LGYVLRSGVLKRIVVARIKLGSDLLLTMKEMVESENIKAGVILSAVGALSRASLRNVKSPPAELPITDGDRSYATFERPFEILSVSGNISEIEGAPAVHAHITLSTVRDGKILSLGGHLIEGCIVYPFAEMVIAELTDISMSKAIEDETRTYQLFTK